MQKFTVNDYKLIEENAKVTFNAGYNKTSFWLTLKDALINVEFWWDDEDMLVATAYADGDVECDYPDTFEDWTKEDFE